MPPSGGKSIPARAHDLSRTGVGLVGVGLGSIGHLVRLSFILQDAKGKEIIECAFGVIVQVRGDESVTYWRIDFTEPLSEASTPTLLCRLDRS
jgi:hypothetical protein